jgi:hypothetical protein
MKNLKSYSSILFLCIVGIMFASSCTKTWITEDIDSSQTEIFTEMWNDINDNYIFFDQKEVDWQTVKETTEAKLQDNLNQEQVFTIHSEMLSQLKDGHVSLYSPFNSWKYHELYLDHPNNYNEDIIQRNYLSAINEIGPFTYDILDNNTGYLRYSSFGDDIETQHLTYLREYFNDTKGLIIDLRGNLGGAADNVAQLLKLSLKEDITLGKVITKVDGSLSEDTHVISSTDAFEAYDSPVVVLTNRQCYSSCNIYASYASQLPGITIMGDSTGGGSGLAVSKELSNGWQYRYSAAKITLQDGSEIENGLTPDIKVSSDESDALEGKDAILDMALEILK